MSVRTRMSPTARSRALDGFYPPGADTPVGDKKLGWLFHHKVRPRIVRMEVTRLSDGGGVLRAHLSDGSSLRVTFQGYSVALQLTKDRRLTCTVVELPDRQEI